MTYQQKFEELRKEFTQKGNRYIKAEKDLSSILGWGDSVELAEFLNAKQEFEEADKKYHEFLLEIKNNKAFPDSEYAAK